MAEKLEGLKDEGRFVGWVEGEQGLAEMKQPSIGDDQLATKRNRMKAQLDDLEHE